MRRRTIITSIDYLKRGGSSLHLLEILIVAKLYEQQDEYHIIHMEEIHRRHKHKVQMPCMTHNVSCKTYIETATELNEL